MARDQAIWVTGDRTGSARELDVYPPGAVIAAVVIGPNHTTLDKTVDLVSEEGGERGGDIDLRREAAVDVDSGTPGCSLVAIHRVSPLCAASDVPERFDAPVDVGTSVSSQRDALTGLVSDYLFVATSGPDTGREFRWTVTEISSYDGSSIETLMATIDSTVVDETVDRGFVPVDASEVGRLISSYEISDLPVELPGAFSLASVFYAPVSTASFANPKGIDVVVATYRNGFDQITLSVRSSQIAQRSPDVELRSGEWQDPYADLGGEARFKTDLVLTGVTSGFSKAAVDFMVPLHVFGTTSDVFVVVETSSTDAVLQDALDVIATVL